VSTARATGRQPGRRADLPDVDGLVRTAERLAICVEAGLSWQAALAESGADRLAPAVDPRRRGSGDMGPTADRRVGAPARRGPSPGAGQLAVLVAVRVVERLGAPAAGVLRRAAAGVREGVAADGRRASAVAGPATSARIVGVLPLAGPLVAWLLGVDVLAVLLGTSWGRGCAVLGLALLVLSWWWSRRLVRTATAAAGGGGGVDEAVVCDLVAAALEAGVATARGLREVAAAMDAVPGADPQGLAGDLERCAVGLDTGDVRLVAVSPGLSALLDAVTFSLRTGAPAGRPLLLAADEIRRRGEQRVATATARLAARLVLPLGAAALPGFLLLGVAPVVVELLGAGLQ
jgi:tight adherence protein B